VKLRLRVGDETREVRVLRRGDRLKVTFEDGRESEARLLTAGGGAFELELDHSRIHGAGAVLGPSQRQLWMSGRTFTFTREERGGGVAREDGDAAGLSATIPAVVVEVLVVPGDAVAKGQKLLLLESMKMVLPIQAPHDGVVKDVLCAQGDSVQPGVPLVALERGGG